MRPCLWRKLVLTSQILYGTLFSLTYLELWGMRLKLPEAITLLMMSGILVVSLICIGAVRSHNCHQQIFNSPDMIPQASSHSR
jgi:hypothetical protein